MTSRCRAIGNPPGERGGQTASVPAGTTGEPAVAGGVVAGLLALMSSATRSSTPQNTPNRPLGLVPAYRFRAWPFFSDALTGCASLLRADLRGGRPSAAAGFAAVRPAAVWSLARIRPDSPATGPVAPRRISRVRHLETTTEPRQSSGGGLAEVSDRRPSGFSSVLRREERGGLATVVRGRISPGLGSRCRRWPGCARSGLSCLGASEPSGWRAVLRVVMAGVTFFLQAIGEHPAAAGLWVRRVPCAAGGGNASSADRVAGRRAAP